MDIAQLIADFGFSVVMVVGLGYFVYFVWQTINYLPNCLTFSNYLANFKVYPYYLANSMHFFSVVYMWGDAADIEPET